MAINMNLNQRRDCCRPAYIAVALLTGTTILLAHPARAHKVEARHGSISYGEQVSVEGGLTITLQSSDQLSVNDEALMSADLLSRIPLPSGVVTIYTEGASSLRNGGIATLIPGANADAGSAADDNGKGRLQISVLSYEQKLGNGYIYLSLLDPTSYLDGSLITNDETHQFLSTGFVNNPAIAFPDYTLGLSVHGTDDADKPDLILFISSSHGLADNPQNSYSELLDLSADGKGLFSALEFNAPWRDWRVRAGLWHNSAELPRLDGNGTDSGQGLYTSIDGQLSDSLAWNLRLGTASKAVNPLRQFASLAFTWSHNAHSIGAAFGRNRISDQAATATDRDITQLEVYYGLLTGQGFEWSGSLQWFSDALPDSASSGLQDEILLASVRLTWAF